jgi:hypothetical protein
MKRLFYFLACLFSFGVVAAQTWTQKADFTTIARDQVTAFTIGSKGYAGTGFNGASNNVMSDFWSYDPGTNVWTQLANFGGSARKRAAGFSIGSKGYIGTGEIGGFSYVKDFWEYDPSTNTWTRKADFPGVARAYATGFSIGSVGYIGTGYNGTAQSDFYEYNPATNTWTTKANFGGGVRFYAASFTVSGKAYVGTGSSASNIFTQDLWEYNPSTNAWLQRANFPGLARQLAAGFSIGSKGYIGLGNRGGSINSQDFYEFDPSTNSWTSAGNFTAGARLAGFAFAIGTKGYVGSGSLGPSGPWYKDFWEFTPAASTSPAATCITLQPNAASGKDSYVESANPTIALGATGVDFPAIRGTNGGNPAEDKAFIQFDLSSVPANAVIQSATYTLYANTTTLFGTPAGTSTFGTANACYVKRVTSSWTEAGLTWNNQPTVTSIDQVLLPQSTSANQNYDLNVTTFVQFWVQNPSQNYGMDLEIITPNTYNGHLFCSSDHSDASKHPKLVICYTLPVGGCTHTVALSLTHTPATTGNNGSINLTVTGSAGPYSYSWTGPNGFTASTEDLTSLATGTYNVTVTPATGCAETSSIIVTGCNNTISLSMSPHAPSFGNNNGAVNLTVNGHDAPYTYSWTGPNGFTAVSEDISSLAIGTYNVTVTPATGCPLTGTINLGLTTSVPTLSQWGLIILTLLSLTLVLAFMLYGQSALSIAGTGSSFVLLAFMRSMPFNKQLFGKILMIILPVAMLGFLAVHYFSGTNGTLDFIGTMISAIIVGYMIQLVIAKK